MELVEVCGMLVGQYQVIVVNCECKGVQKCKNYIDVSAITIGAKVYVKLTKS